MIYKRHRIFASRACGKGGVGGAAEEQEQTQPPSVKCAIKRRVGARSVAGRAERERTKIEGSAATGRKETEGAKEKEEVGISVSDKEKSKAKITGLNPAPCWKVIYTDGLIRLEMGFCVRIPKWRTIEMVETVQVGKLERYYTLVFAVACSLFALMQFKELCG